jgi:hypothetical protein
MTRAQWRHRLIAQQLKNRLDEIAEQNREPRNTRVVAQTRTTGHFFRRTFALAKVELFSQGRIRKISRKKRARQELNLGPSA